jgi:GT2 family glycosyltransferase
MIDIVIPFLNEGEMTGRCIDAVRLHTKDYRMILIDDGSTPEECEIVKSKCSQDTVLLHNPGNKGFVISINNGWKFSETSMIAILNNDAEVTPKWLAKLSTYMLNHPRCGIVGAITEKIGIPWRPLWGRFPNPGEAANASREIYRPVRGCVPFFCTLFRRSMINKVGFLDEEFSPGLGDDDDYCDRARLGGWETGVLMNTWVHHRHRTSMSKIPNMTEMQKEHIALFWKKYHARRGKG